MAVKIPVRMHYVSIGSLVGDAFASNVLDFLASNVPAKTNPFFNTRVTSIIISRSGKSVVMVTAAYHYASLTRAPVIRCIPPFTRKLQTPLSL